MEIFKTLKKATRGLTFSLRDKDAEIGSQMIYFVDKAQKEITIVPKEQCTELSSAVTRSITVSRKKSGKVFKPLIDIRTKEVKSLVSSADYLAVEVKDGRIIVHCLKKASEKSQIEIVNKKILRISDFMETDTIEFRMAAGCEGQLSFSDVFPSWDSFTNAAAALSTSVRDTIQKDLVKIYQLASFFSGGGLSDWAWFKDNRVNILYALDFSHTAVDCYRHNIGDVVHREDIHNVTGSDLPEALDIMVATPCCQAFSQSNRSNMNSQEAEDKRRLIVKTAELIKDRQPSTFVIENVPQFLSANDGYYYRLMTDMLGEDYEIIANVIDDDKVGGYTRRQRCIVVGALKSMFSNGIHLPKLNLMTPRVLRDALSKVDDTWPNQKDVSVNRPETTRAMASVPQGGNYKDIPEELLTFKVTKNTHSDMYRRGKLDEPLYTLANWRKTLSVHPTENRGYTVSEAAAIMGLEKDFNVFVTKESCKEESRMLSESKTKATGKPSKVNVSPLGAKQQIIANGVPQAIMRFVKEAVLKALDAYYGVNSAVARVTI